MMALAPITSESPSSETIAMTDILVRHPDLCFEGWRTPKQSEADFVESRRKLEASHDAFKLSIRVFKDRKFRRQHSGRIGSYRLKHVAEFWDFTSSRSEKCRPPRYNGIFISEGVATAAALIEGFRVARVSLISCSSAVDVPWI